MVTLLYISPPKKKFVNFSRSKYKEELWRSASPQAIRANNLCNIKSLITNGADFQIKVESPFLFVPYAAKSYKNIVLLVELGTILNSKNTDGFPFTFGSYGYRTPLHAKQAKRNWVRYQ